MLIAQTRVVSYRARQGALEVTVLVLPLRPDDTETVDKVQFAANNGGETPARVAANASAVAWLGSKSREAAEAIGLARKEALGLDDEDLIFVNLKPPPPSGGAGDDLLDEREARLDGDASASRDALKTAGGSGTYVNYE